MKINYLNYFTFSLTHSITHNGKIKSLSRLNHTHPNTSSNHPAAQFTSSRHISPSSPPDRTVPYSKRQRFCPLSAGPPPSLSPISPSFRFEIRKRYELTPDSTAPPMEARKTPHWLFWQAPISDWSIYRRMTVERQDGVGWEKVG